MISAHFWAPVRGANFDRKLAQPNTRWRYFSLNWDSCAPDCYGYSLLLFYKVFWSDFNRYKTDFWTLVCQRIQRQKLKLHDKNQGKSTTIIFFKYLIFFNKVFSRKFLYWKKIVIPVYLPLLMECTFLKSWFLLACIFILATFPYKDTDESFTLTNG